MKDFKTNLKALVLLLSLALMLPLSANAQYYKGSLLNDDPTAEWNQQGLMNNRDNITIWTAANGIQNDPFGAPLGNGIAILLAAGAGYALVRRKRSRKNTMLLLACVALLGFTQCKKEEPLEPQGEHVRITLNVRNGNNNSKAEVNPPYVTFATGDKILVVSDGHYVGTLTHNGTNFSGNITDPVVDEPLYFYFLGNKDTGTLTPGTSGSTSCSVNISDQTDYPHLPVISMGVSINRSTGETVDYSSGVDTYEAQLHNKCSLMKFNVTTGSNSPIHITGMNNKVMVDFSTPEGADNGFSYDKAGDGIIKMKGGSGTNVEKWIIVLKQGDLSEDADGAYSADGSYVGTRPAINAITENGLYLNSGIDMTVNTSSDRSINLAGVTGNTTINDGYRVYGTLGGNYKISIADGATVTLSGVSINANGNWKSDWAGLTCLGDATIILADGTTNTVNGFSTHYPGIHVPSGKTLTIQGTGTLNASSNDYSYAAGIGGGKEIPCGNITINSGTITATCRRYNSAGIGGGDKSSCGNITINGGTVTATGGDNGAGIGCGNDNASSCGDITINGGTVTATGGNYAAGIGGGHSSTCGDITINGGTVTATGGKYAAGIGSGYPTSSSCGAITIENTVTSVTATKGSSATNSIGKGSQSSTCGTVTIGGTVYYNGSSYQNGGDTYLATSPLVFPAPTLQFFVIDPSYINATIWFISGETWSQAITNHASENSGWTIGNHNTEVHYDGCYILCILPDWDEVLPSDEINPEAGYRFMN